MEYTIKNGKYFVVHNKDTNEIITFGEMQEETNLATIHNVTFISEPEYNDLVESKNNQE